MASRKTDRDIPKVKLNKDNLKKSLRLFRYMSNKNRWLFALGTVFLAISAGASILFPKLLGNMMDGVFQYNNGQISTAPNKEKIQEIAQYFILLFAVQALFSFLRISLYVKVTEDMTKGIRTDLFDSIVRQNLHFFGENRTGQILSRFSADIAQIQDTFTTNLAFFLRQIIVLIAGIVLIFISSRDLAFYMVISIPVVVVFALIFGKFIRKISKEVQDITAENNVIVEEVSSGIIHVKAYTNESFESQRYSQNADFLKKESIKRGYWRGAFSSFIIICLFGTIIWLIYVGLGMVQSGQMPIGELFSFMLLTAFVGTSMGGMAEQFVQIQKTLGAVDRVLDIIEQPKEHNKNQLIVDLNQTIQLENVSFSYPSRPQSPVLKNISMVLPPGKITALVGPSGSGKSTITSLLYQFYQVSEGQILMGNTPINHIDLHHYRSQMALVPQEISLFGGSILDNIKYGKPDALPHEIEQAAKDAFAYDFIVGFPEGFETLVGDRGMKLSGGQKQRIAIARAILRNPKILILDEATSALDSESEYYVQEALKTLMKGRTSLVIAHRLSTIKNADHIWVLKHGSLVESGNHETLIAIENGIYRQMVDRQMDPNDFFTS
jgi:ABC-type multidrug transport system fused ATPase/permease subunit